MSATCRYQNGLMEPMPEHPLDGQEVWVKCRVKVHSDWDGWPLRMVLEGGELADVEWRYIEGEE